MVILSVMIKIYNYIFKLNKKKFIDKIYVFIFGVFISIICGGFRI